MKFEDLRLSEPLLRALITEGYTVPTPIQVKAIPHILEGKDLLGCAQTGTGKTAAFALPILQRLSASRPGTPAPAAHAAPAHVTHQQHGHRDLRAPQTSHTSRRPIRALVLSPTRELAAQIGDSFRAYGRHLHLKPTVIFGGVNQNPQVRALKEGVDVVVATPGRLLDLMNQGYVDLRSIEVLVLDEADRMLDMGFIHDIRKIVAKLPASTHRQTLFFSATMPGDIRHLAASILRDPVSVQVAPESATAERIEQGVYFVEKRNKSSLLTHLLNGTSFTRALVFTRTKHGADKVAKQLHHAGITAEAIHGNKSQNARQRALLNFKTGKTPVLIASDIAARGIDIDEISHVINYDMPNVPETYVHRIGRTGRAGASGRAISFCDQEEREYLRDIERLTRIPVPVLTDHPAYPARQDFAPQHDSRGSHPHGNRGEQRPQRAPRSGSGGASHNPRHKGPARPPQSGASHGNAAQPHAPRTQPSAPGHSVGPTKTGHNPGHGAAHAGRPSFRSGNQTNRP